MVVTLRIIGSLIACLSLIVLALMLRIALLDHVGATEPSPIPRDIKGAIMAWCVGLIMSAGLFALSFR